MTTRSTYGSDGRSRHRRQPALQHAVDLGVQRRLDVGRAAEQVPGPGQRVGGRLVAGEEDRHRLVAHLLIGHPAAIVFVLRGEQHRQQVAVIAAAGAAVGDHAVDDRVEPRARHAGAAQLRHRQPLEHVGERQHHHPERFHHRGQRLADRGGLRLDVDVEQRLADDRQRQAVHLARDVERRAVAPARRACAIGVADHQVAVAGDAIAVEGRLHQAALAQVHRAFAGQQPLAEQPLAALEAAALGEVAVVGDEDVANQPRLVDEEQLLAGHPVGADVAVGARQAR